MSEIFFVIKTFFVSVVLVFLMQINIGQFTLEEHFLDWARGSFIASYLKKSGDGAVSVVGKSWKQTKSWFHENVGRKFHRSDSMQSSGGVGSAGGASGSSNGASGVSGAGGPYTEDDVNAIIKDEEYSSELSEEIRNYQVLTPSSNEPGERRLIQVKRHPSTQKSKRE